jgi:hypothetical protein
LFDSSLSFKIMGAVFSLLAVAAVAAIVSSVVGPAVASVCPLVTMVAPGVAGQVISRAAFLANPQLYFAVLHKDGGLAAVRMFAG